MAAPTAMTDATPYGAAQSWLLLTVGEDRQHGGNDGYGDDARATYRWDSTVPHHADLTPGDAIVLWDKKTSIGASVIEDIHHGATVKTLNRCPNCKKASIKARRSMLPTYKCYTCKETFNHPDTIRKEVTTYETRHDVAWVDLEGVLTGAQLRALCKDPASQQSMRPLRWDAFRNAVAAQGLRPALDSITSSATRLLGGHHERTVRVRIGQQQFRKSLIDKYGAVCAFTGHGPLPTLEAGHLYSYASAGVHDSEGGLLLRRDVHRLFDLGFLTVDPKSLSICVKPELDQYDAYHSLNGQKLHVVVTEGQRKWLAQHWAAHTPS
ncbi:HNH endonuclease [Arthrobacter sp. B0490]|uniref:HNH endonuclease n=1 Tax=Arthrobacter sp. B0490 TaxID=2058891 RepID=UPI0011B0D149|nr:HNH endonuclease signature motif containing protein [Arthrobacter sp. B0490]